MNNFKKHKHQPGRRRPTSIDGFVGGSQLPRPVVQPAQTHRSQHIGNFAASDGFYPNEQGKIAFGSQLGRQPHRTTDGSIALDMPPETVPRTRRRGKKVRKERSRGRRILRNFIIAFVVTILLIGGFLGWKVLRNTSKVFNGNIFGLVSAPKKLKGEESGRVNILLAGNSSDDPGHDGANLTDSIMLLSIDTANNNAFMMSIPRDLWVSYGTKECSVGYQGKINATYVCGEQIDFKEEGYPEGGMGLLQKVVEQKFGLKIHYYTKINYTAFRDAVNAVGGIDVTIQTDDPRGLYDGNIAKVDGGPLKLKNGLQHLDGQTALNLARARCDTVCYGFKRGDFDRTENQRMMLLALKDKALSAGVLSNPAKIGGLLDAAGDNVSTNFQTSEIRRLYDLSKLIKNENIKSIGLADDSVNLVKTGTINTQSVVIPVAGVSDFSQIQAFLKRLTSNDPILKENAKVVVLNASGVTGAALKESNLLKEKGLNVTTVATASKLRPTNVIVSLGTAQKPATKAYLEQKYGVVTTTDIVNNADVKNYQADFVIILGQQ